MRKINKRKRKRAIIIFTALLIILFCSIFFIGKAINKNKQDNEAVIDNPPKGEQDEDKESKTDWQPEDETETNEPEQDEIPPLNELGIIESPDAYDVLVNKKRNLPDDYVPSDLVTLTEVPTVLNNPEVNQLREEAYEALKELFTAAKEEEDYELYARSGYRSYNTQVSLYSSYVANSGQEAADKFSAKPGQSEHQTGLSIDITSKSMNLTLDETFGETDEGKWVKENAFRFGFIVRYPKGKEQITGYMYEPWHIRYLGTDLAKKVYESGLTLEEYFESQE